MELLINVPCPPVRNEIVRNTNQDKFGLFTLRKFVNCSECVVTGGHTDSLAVDAQMYK